MKLLRALESREVRRVGGVESHAVDVRFVVATNRDLPALVEAGSFRRDLYYRMNGITIVVPPLRERRDEILPLAHSFVGAAGLLSDAAETALLAYGFPGNVRELRNVMDRARVLSRGSEILPEHLLLPVPATPSIATSLSAAVGSIEQQRIHRALEESGGNQTRAAKLLGISRRTMVNRLAEYGLPRPRKK